MNTHEHFIHQAIAVARSAKKKGNLPFGCILVDDQDTVLEIGENEINSSKDSIAHAEIVLIHKLAGRYTREYLSRCTIYTTDEPCPMCASAIYWSGIGRLVFGLRKTQYYELTGRTNLEYIFEIPCCDVLKHGGRKVNVVGPVAEDDVIEIHNSKLD